MTAPSIAGLGTRDDHVAQTPRFDAQRLTPDERSVFNAIGRVAKIGDVLRGCGLPESRAIATLLALRMKGAVAPARVQQSQPPPVASDVAMLEQVDLDDAKKKEILELERLIEHANHFEALGTPNHAAPEVVKKAFYEASRKFHPDRFFGKNLGSFRARLEKIFRHLTDAQATLTDPAKRKAYLEAHREITDTHGLQAKAASEAPPPPKPRTAEDDARDAERRARLLRHPYLAKNSRVNEMVTRAKGHMAKGDFNLAFNDLQLAVQMDDRNAEAKQLYAEVRKKHDHQRALDELKRGDNAMELGDSNAALGYYRTASTLSPSLGAAAFKAAGLLVRHGSDPKEASVLAQRAVEAEPNKVEYRALWAQVLDAAGMKSLAKKQWEEVVRLDPNHPEGKKQVKRIWPF